MLVHVSYIKFLVVTAIVLPVMALFYLCCMFDHKT